MERQNEETVYLKLFPFSLKDKAKNWLNALPPHSIKNWLELQAEFLKKFFPLHRTQGLQRQIKNFAQLQNESFCATWERFNELLLSCPHHGFELCNVIAFFFEGLQSSMKLLVETMCNGQFFDKSEDEAWNFLGVLAENTQQWNPSDFDRTSTSSTQPQAQGGMYNLKPEDSINVRLDALVSKKLHELELKNVSEVAVEQICSLCNHSGHEVEKCPTLPALQEMLSNPTEVNWVNNNGLSNTYNSSWKNHPNLKWGPQQNQQQQPQGQGAYVHPNQPSFQEKRDSASEMQGVVSMLQQMMQQQNAHFQQQMQMMQQMQQAQQQQLNNHLSTSAPSIEKGKLPSQALQNPNIGSTSNAGQNFKNCQAITLLRSGKELQKPELPMQEQEEATEANEDEKQEDADDEQSASKGKKNEITAEDIKYAPFPSRLQMQSKDKYLTEISSIFAKCQVNIPLLEVIKQVPRYAKFLKDLCTQKRTLKVRKKLFLAENVSAIVQNNVRKLKDPGAPYITCTIGTTIHDRCLLDLGSSVNILPYHIYTKMGLGTIKPTTVTLQLADRSIKIPRGQVEDVIIRVKDFYYPVDFIVLDIPISSSSLIPQIILGRPFLATCNAQIGCREGNLKISFGDMSKELNIFHPYKSEPEVEDVNFIDSCESVEDELVESCVEDYCEYNFDPATAYYENCFQDVGTSDIFHVQGIQEEIVAMEPLVENIQLPLQIKEMKLGKAAEKKKKKKKEHLKKKRVVTFVNGQHVMLVSKLRTSILGPYTVVAQKPNGKVKLMVEGQAQGFTVHANMLELVPGEGVKLGEIIQQAKDPPLGGV